MNEACTSLVTARELYIYGLLWYQMIQFNTTCTKQLVIYISLHKIRSYRWTPMTTSASQITISISSDETISSNRSLFFHNCHWFEGFYWLYEQAEFMHCQIKLIKVPNSIYNHFWWYHMYIIYKDVLPSSIYNHLWWYHMYNIYKDMSEAHEDIALYTIHKRTKTNQSAPRRRNHVMN
jgi:hypothetical protein